MYFGAKVQLENTKGNIINCKIVGVDEIDTKKNHISVISPIAKAIIGKKTNDAVTVTVKNEKEKEIEIEMTIKQITYDTNQ